MRNLSMRISFQIDEKRRRAQITTVILLILVAALMIGRAEIPLGSDAAVSQVAVDEKLCLVGAACP
jgi:hypothetical protein